MPLEEQLDKVTRSVTKYLKQAMIEKDYTQAEIASMLCLNKSAISRAVNGDNNPQSRKVRKKMYKILGMDGE